MAQKPFLAWHEEMMCGRRDHLPPRWLSQELNFSAALPIRSQLRNPASRAATIAALQQAIGLVQITHCAAVVLPRRLMLRESVE